MAKIEAIVFDLFGTLVESGDPEATIIKEFGLKMPYKTVEKVLCGRTLDAVNEAYLKEIMEKTGIGKKQENLIKLQQLLEKELEIVKPFPDALPTLHYLKGQNLKLGLVTGSWAPAIEKVKKFGILEFFGSVIRSDKTMLFKPNPKAYEKCLKELGVKPENAVMVGDSLQNDVVAPTKIGLKGILLNRKRKRICSKEPFAVISNLNELKKVLKNKSN